MSAQGAADRVAAAPVPSGAPPWTAVYAARLLIVDCLAIFLAMTAAVVLRFGWQPEALLEIPYTALAGLLGPVWLGLLYLGRSYELRFIGVGSTEFRRVIRASLRLFAYVAVGAYVLRFDLARGFVAIAFPLGTLLLLLGRYSGRHWLRRKRATHGWTHRVIVVGDPGHVGELARVIAREDQAGFSVVGACLPGASDRSEVDGVPVVASLSTLIAAAHRHGADTIAVTSSPAITPATVRQLSWDMEGSGMALVLAPALTDVAGPRISIRPVSGLPLLHLDEPEFTGARRLAKETQDRVLCALALIVLAPLLGAIALLVRLTSPGPALFAQERVGLGGRTFRMLKFRSMCVDAEQQLEALRGQNEADAASPLFKLRRDPRVTPLGRVLRAWSLDELPQLVNVLRGDMALVGPRPPLSSEVTQYQQSVRRRLLVKPGVTGLWQVNGRSALSWEESVRLDLYYVENWSLALDLSILAKTVLAVLTRSGAY